MDLTYQWPEITGLIGVGIYVLMYYLLIAGKIKSRNLTYSMGNFIGACCVLVGLMFFWNSVLIILQCIWLLISIYGIVKAFAKQ